MKKLLLVALTLTTVNQITPEWREHEGILGGALNLGEAIVDVPGDVVDGTRGYDYYENGRGRYYSNRHDRRDGSRFRDRHAILGAPFRAVDGDNRRDRRERRHEKRNRENYENSRRNNG